MNKQQSAYTIARAAYDAMTAEGARLERDFITAHGVKNPDGTTPGMLHLIDDYNLFCRLCDKFEQSTAAKEFNARYGITYDNLRAAEDALIQFVIASLPNSKEKKTIRENAWKLNVRNELLDIAMRARD